MRYRKIHLDSQEWKYIITSDLIIILSPANKKTIVDRKKFLKTLGWIEEEIIPCEDDFWDHFSISIGPQMIKTYIKERIDE